MSPYSVDMFPSEFISVNTATDLGLDLTALQKILDAEKNIVLFADIGLTRSSQTSFVSILKMTLQALIPLPRVVIATGGDQDSVLPSELNMHILRDSTLKRALHTQVSLIKTLSTNEMITAMIAVSIMPSPPSSFHRNVLEALCILLTTKSKIVMDEDEEEELLLSKGFIGPSSTISAVSWRICRQLLSDPSTLLTSFLQLSRKIHTNILSVLKLYISHTSWPNISQRSSDIILHLLASAVEISVEIFDYYFNFGVVTESLVKQVTQIQSVVVFNDEIIPSSSPNYTRMVKASPAINHFEGWSTPISRLLTATLQDITVYRSVIQIDESSYRIRIYRDKNTFFFSAYDPITSHVYTTHLFATDVSRILRSTQKPPDSFLELYVRLGQCLHFKYSKNYEKVLICDNRMQKLRSEVRMHLSGYNFILTGYSAASSSGGSIVLEAFNPNRGVSLQFNFTRELAKKVASSSMFPSEEQLMLQYNALENADTVSHSILFFLLDRLVCFPSSPFQSFYSNTTLQLKLRKTKYPGKPLYRKFLQKGQMRFLVSIFLSSFDESIIVSF